MKPITKLVKMNDGSEQRRGARIPVHVPVMFEGEGRTGQGSTFNVSTWGCGVESHVPMPAGLYVGVSFSLPDRRLPLEVELAAVRWSRRNQFGMEFLSISKENRNRLEEFLARARSDSSLPPALVIHGAVPQHYDSATQVYARLRRPILGSTCLELPVPICYSALASVPQFHNARSVAWRSSGH